MGGTAAHSTETAELRSRTTDTKMRPRGERAVRLLGASAGWARGLVTPSHGLGARRNAGFSARGLFASLILGLLPMEHGFLVLGRFFRLGSGGRAFFLVAAGSPGPASSG